MRIRRQAALAWMAALLLPLTAAAQDRDTGPGEVAFRLPTSVKITGLLSRLPPAPDLFPVRNSRDALFRVRAEPELTARGAVFSLSYEHQVRFSSGSAPLVTLGFLPAVATPFRIRQLNWSVATSSHAAWRHDIDRASARVELGPGTFTIGRQAIGWGRGVMFGAVDLFAPFMPLEVDREWRAGIDALHADVKLTERSSFDVVAAFGPAWDRSALAARLRGYLQAFDVEIVGGRRARDSFAGVTTSAPVGDAELHGELAAFRSARTIWKAVAGGSFRVPVGAGVLTYVEYHYSGFGAPEPEQIVPLLAEQEFVERYLRGDMQVLSRHVVGVTSQYEPSPLWAFSAQWLQNVRDASGIAVPGVTVTLNDSASLIATGHLPYGRRPVGRVLRSEFGIAPFGALLQLRLYR